MSGVWVRPDGTLVVDDPDERYGADVMWLAEGEEPPADAAELVVSSEAEEAITFLREGLGSIAELKAPISVAAYALGLVRAFASVYTPRPVQKRAARQAATYAGRVTRQSDGAAPAAAREEAVQPSGSGLVGPSPEQGDHVTRAQPFTDAELEDALVEAYGDELEQGAGQ